MVRIKVFKSQGRYSGFEVEGHCGYAERGKDIVCSGVSAVTQTAVIGLQHYLTNNVKIHLKDGFLSCSIKFEKLRDNQIDKSQVIIKTMVLGLKNIESAYKGYVSLIIKEV